MPELVLQRFPHAGGDGFQGLLAGGVPGTDEAAQRPLRLHGPDRVRVCLGAVLVVAQDVSRARLVPGDVLPPGVEIILVAVGDHDPGEARQDPGVFHGVQAAGAQPEGGVLLGERAVHVLLLPGRPGAQRGLIEPGDRRGGDQGADQPHHVRGQGRCLRQAGMDEPIGHGSAGDVGDQLPAPLHGNMLEDDQVNRQGTQPRPDGQRRIRHARRAGRGMGPAAGAPGLVQVVLHPLRRRGRDLLLLIGPGNPQVSGTGQATAARAGALGMVILGPVRDLPRHGRPRAARLLPALLLLRPLSSTPLLPRRPPARQVIRARRHRGVPAVPRPRARRRLQLLPKAGNRRLQRGDLPGLRRDQLRLLPDQRITRIRGRIPGRHIGHSPQSSRKPRPPTTATPRPTLERNPRSLAATPSPGT